MSEQHLPASESPDPVASGTDDPAGTTSARPAASPGPEAPAPRHTRVGRRWWIGGIAIAVLVVVVLAPLASSDPDGLMKVAGDQGFIGQAQNVIGGLLGGYSIPGIEDSTLSKILSGLLGLAIVAGLLFLLGRVVTRRRA